MPTDVKLTKKELEAERLERDMQIIQMIASGSITYAEIGEKVGCHESTVNRIAKKYGKMLGTLRDLPVFRGMKVSLMEGVQVEALKSVLDSGKLEESTAQQAVGIVEKLNSMIRLEQGKSTVNTETHVKTFTDD